MIASKWNVFLLLRTHILRIYSVNGGFFSEIKDKGCVAEILDKIAQAWICLFYVAQSLQLLVNLIADTGLLWASLSDLPVVIL